MAFLFGLLALLECLGKADKGREERDHSGQELHELSEIGHGHHLPSDGGLCPARGLPPARTILSERLALSDQFTLLTLAKSAGMAESALNGSALGHRRRAFQNYQDVSPLRYRARSISGVPGGFENSPPRGEIGDAGVDGPNPPAAPTDQKRRRSRDAVIFPGAPGRIRTVDTRFRRAVLYPLSYGGMLY